MYMLSIAYRQTPHGAFHSTYFKECFRVDREICNLEDKYRKPSTSLLVQLRGIQEGPSQTLGYLF